MEPIYSKKLFILILATWVFLFVGCIEKTVKEIPVYNLDNIIKETELKLTNLVDNIRIVPLETNDNLQVSESMFGGYKIAVTKEYIIIMGDKAVTQFDAITGKFIRSLTTSGRGPQEYGVITSYTINYNNDILYISHSSGTNKLVVNLKTGQMLSPIITTLPISLNDLFITPDGSIGVADDSLMFGKIDVLSGEYTPVLNESRLNEMKEKKRSKFITHFGCASLGLNEDDLYLFNQKISDTLYRYNSPNDCEGVMVVYSNDIDNEFEGSTIKIPYIDNKTAIYSTYSLKYGQDKNGSIYVLNTPRQLYKMTRDNRMGERISKFIFNPLFIMREEGSSAAKFFNKSYFSNSTFYAKILDAYIVKEAIALTLEDTSLSQKIIRALNELDSKLTENSNPVVVIGEKR
ncbi:MAG: 6-bladed beta-propeller [Bacteroidales bacterium]